MFPKAKLPTAIQVGVSAETYAQMLKHPQCARLGRECSRRDENGMYVPCEPLRDGEYAVELDHIVPKALGGLNSLDNLQWLCACQNRSKYTRPDERYAGELYFDQEIELSTLREHQLLLGYKRATVDYRGLFEAPEKLLQRFILLAWLVGAGKTIGMASILFGINQVRKRLNGGAARRVKRVLWLVHQRSLVVSIAEELRTELTKHGLVPRAPEVVEVRQAGEWGYIADIVVACPQSLWDAKNNTLTDERRAQILSEFDVIVVDEAQFGVDRYLQISSLAPQAFKFAVTATPMDSDGTLFCDIDNGKYRDWFALYSSFGYDSGRNAGFYKNLAPFDEGYGKQYHEERGGIAAVRQGAVVELENDTRVVNNAARAMALIGRARSVAIAASSQTNFDHQIMVRAGSISHAKGLLEAIAPENDSCGVWSGSSGPLLGDKRHPWMLTKVNGGRIPPKGKRIVITVDIGQFGINNPYCSIVVWVEPNLSIVEIVQRIGRAIRRIKGQDDAEVQLFWDGAKARMAEQLKSAITYMLDMEERVKAFVSLAEIDGDPNAIEPSPAERGLNPEDRTAICSLIGERMSQGLDEDAATASALAELSAHGGWSGDYFARAEVFAETLKEEEGRQKALKIPAIFEPSRLVEREAPQTDYSAGRLLANVENGLLQPRLTGRDRENLIEAVRQESLVVLRMLENELREIDERNRNLDALTFYPPSVIAGMKKAERPLPFKTLQQQIVAALKPAVGPRIGKAMPLIMKTLRIALREYYGLPSFKRECYQSFEGPLADAMMRDDEQRRILAKTYFMFVRLHPEMVPGLAKRFEHELAGASADAA